MVMEGGRSRAANTTANLASDERSHRDLSDRENRIVSSLGCSCPSGIGW